MENKSSKKKIFVSIIWGYPTHMYGFSPEENYHLHILKMAKDLGYDTVAIVHGSADAMRGDPNFDRDTLVIDYKNIFHFIYRVLLYSFKGSLFYVNSYEWQSFIVPFLARNTIFMAHTQPKRQTVFKQKIQNFVYGFFTAIRLNNESEKEFLINEGVDIKKLHVVPLVVSTETFKIVGGDNHPERKDLVYFGNVTPTKNLNTILLALRKVLNQKPDIKLNIIGEVADSGFVDQINKLGLEKSVILHGHMAQDEKLVKTLNSMLVFVNSSKIEGQCVAVYDAALCGCVLCLPNIMSFSGVFRDKVLFHNKEDFDALAGNIIKYVDNPELSIKHNNSCVEMIKRNYSKDHIDTLLKNLLNNFI